MLGGDSEGDGEPNQESDPRGLGVAGCHCKFCVVETTVVVTILGYYDNQKS